MKTKKNVSGLYAIVDSNYPAGGDMVGLAAKYVCGGVGVLQLRVKPLENSQGEAERAKKLMLSVASEVAGFKKNNDFILIINDHADIACQVGADGVHVGTNDMPVTEIRKTFGDEIMIGFSSHSAEEAKKAWEMGADYVAFGAIFPTKTKGPGHPVQGLEKLREVVAAASIPVVAIGGICRENIEGVLKTGVSSVAMISALALANDPVLEAISYGRLIRRFLGASR